MVFFERNVFLTRGGITETLVLHYIGTRGGYNLHEGPFTSLIQKNLVFEDKASAFIENTLDTSTKHHIVDGT